MNVVIARLSAHVPQGGTDNADANIPEEAFLVKKEGGEWALKHITWSEGESRASKHLKIASNQDIYSVSNYAQFVPNQARLGQNRYVDTF